MKSIILAALVGVLVSGPVWAGEGVTSCLGIAKALNARGIPTARGGYWYAGTVKNVINRVA